MFPPGHEWRREGVLGDGRNESGLTTTPYTVSAEMMKP
jgi:hypothetical protein